MGLAKCPDDKTKTNRCDMSLTEGTRSNSHSVYLVFDECGKGKICDTTCKPEHKYRKVGQSCNYNEDCITELCSSGECSALGEGKDCSGGESCGAGLYCDSTCKKLFKENENAGAAGKCWAGLAKNTDGVCRKYEL